MIKIGHEFGERRYPLEEKFQFSWEYPYTQCIVGEFHLEVDWRGHSLTVRNLNQEGGDV